MSTARRNASLTAVERSPDGAESERTTMTGQAAEAVRDMIILGQLPPGESLRLDELARMLRMSVSPIREALRQLEMSGLVTYSPYRGATVTRLSIDEMATVYETRVGIESIVVRRLAERFDQDVERELYLILAELDAAYAASDRLRVVRVNTNFHIALAAGCGSPWLERLVKQVHEVWERYSAALIPSGKPEEAFGVEVQGHQAIIHACARRDPDAAEDALRRHLEASRNIFERVSASSLLVLERETQREPSPA